MERQVHPHRGREITRPHAAADHHVAAADLTLGSTNTGDFVSVSENRLDLGIREYPCAAALRPFGQRLGDVHRVGVAIRGNVNATEQIVGLYQRVLLGNLSHRQHVHLEPEYLGHGGTALELFKPLGGGRNRDRTALAVAGGLPGLFLEAAVKLAGVARELGHIDRGTQLPHQTRRVPGGAAGQLLALKEHHILNARLGEVIRHRHANDAATDDNHLTAIG